MGEVSETMTKRKKKGRPSLLDLQKRSLKKEQQQRQNIPNSSTNSRSNNNKSVVPHNDDGDGDDDDERKQKKHKLLVGLNSHLHHPTLSPNSPPFHSVPKRRKIDHQTDGKVPKATDSKHGSQAESGPTTPLPDKKLLLFILDRLQKKDTHGVFSEPVDPEELPDYHDIIKHPMDFGTVRKKLDGGLYTDLEHFEKDVFLICSNAMQYNSPDTIYHRQARAMQEISRKDFENLRQDSDDSEPQSKIVHRGRPPSNPSRKALGMPPSERVAPESSSDATLASSGDIASGSNCYNLRKGPSKFQPTELSVRAYGSTFNSGGYSGWSEWENEFPSSVVKAVLRCGKKQFAVDETRRDTYRNPVNLRNERPVLTKFEDEFKQLLAVGLHMKHSYARSLAHFAADLGPVVWKIAASKIGSVLPPSHEFGPGWVSEDDRSQKQHFPVGEEGRTSDHPVPEDYRSRFSSPSGSFPLANRPCLQSGDLVMNNYQNELNPVIITVGGSESNTPVRIQQESMAHSDDFGSHDRLGSNFPSQMKMVKLADLTGSSSTGVVHQISDMDPISSHISHSNINPSLKGQHFSKSSQLDSCNVLARESGFEPRGWSQGLAGKSPWQGLEVPTKQNSFALANDLNGRIETTNSPISNVEAGSRLQPNLALQL